MASMSEVERLQQMLEDSYMDMEVEAERMEVGDEEESGSVSEAARLK